MTASVILLTEQALSASDAERLTSLHAEDAPSYRVLVPADTRRSLIADVLDHLSLLELREALEAARGREDGDRLEADHTLHASLTQLAAIGATVDGAVVHGDPVLALERELADRPADEVVVISRPHAVEDTFHTDWASRARKRLGVPVLHVYAGSSWLG